MIFCILFLFDYETANFVPYGEKSNQNCARRAVQTSIKAAAQLKEFEARRIIIHSVSLETTRPACHPALGCEVSTNIQLRDK